MKMSDFQLEVARESEDFCTVCQEFCEPDEVTDNVCADCATPSDELRFSQMDNPNWCCECCLVRMDVPVENHVCGDCKR